MQRVRNFVSASERVGFFWRLVGGQGDLVDADEVIIYVKCLVYFDVTKTIQANISAKDFTV